MLRNLWPTLPIVFLPLLALAVDTPEQHGRSLEQREHHLSTTLTRASEYIDVPHISAARACEEVHPPEELTTPDPITSGLTHGKRVKVSFIIGTDGRVHSPLILESAGITGDRRVLQTVRTWRYRPATCNGVPTEIEGKVEFSSR